MTTLGSPGRIEMLNGVPLYFEVHGCGEPLVLLRGFSGCSQDWAALPGDWGAEFQLIIPDIAGGPRNAGKRDVTALPGCQLPEAVDFSLGA